MTTKAPAIETRRSVHLLPTEPNAHRDEAFARHLVSFGDTILSPADQFSDVTRTDADATAAREILQSLVQHLKDGTPCRRSTQKKAATAPTSAPHHIEIVPHAQGVAQLIISTFQPIPPERTNSIELAALLSLPFESVESGNLRKAALRACVDLAASPSGVIDVDNDLRRVQVASPWWTCATHVLRHQFAKGYLPTKKNSRIPMDDDPARHLGPILRIIISKGAGEARPKVLVHEMSAYAQKTPESDPMEFMRALAPFTSRSSGSRKDPR